MFSIAIEIVDEKRVFVAESETSEAENQRGNGVMCTRGERARRS
jgi:hypothetical protein